MLTLVLIGLVAGLITGISPCILPVLPVVFVAGGTGVRRSPAAAASDAAASAPGGGTAVLDPPRTRRNLRPYAIIAGLVTSFTVFTLLGTALLTALNLPQDLLRNLGLAVLLAVGIGLLVPKFGELLERPFARLPKRQVNAQGGAFVLGLGLGLLYVPCAGPVLTAITVVSASGRIGLPVVILTFAFAVGASLPLLAFALAGDRVAHRVKAFREHAETVRRVGGVILIVTAVLLAFNVTDKVQRALPGYTAALQAKVEQNATAKKQLQDLKNPGAAVANATGASLANCSDGATKLQNCGPAPEFRNVDTWLNTPGGRPLSFASLKGKVVLLDFWTYSCINCQRTLPQVEAWARDYKDSGLVVVGVHTPEFGFERVPSNVAKAAKDLGVAYPVAIDNGYGTWNAYNNLFWPAEYLVDASGNVRHIHFGEGGYGQTEGFIRQLLADAKSTSTLPRATKVTVAGPSNQSITPETYLGYNRLGNVANAQIAEGTASRYTVPGALLQDSVAFGGTWTIGPQAALAGPQAQLVLEFGARDVHLVLGGSGTVRVSVDGKVEKTVKVAGVPTLYTLVARPSVQTGRLVLDVSPGVAAYAFTFG